MKTGMILIFLLFLLIFSCKDQNENKDLKLAIDQVLSRNELIESKYCIIVPRAGCGGCIDSATYFLKKNIDHLNGVQIILTGIVDRKLLKLEVGEDFLKKKQVHLDTNKVFSGIKLTSLYPQLITLDNGVVVEVTDLDPDKSKSLSSIINNHLN